MFCAFRAIAASQQICHAELQISAMMHDYVVRFLARTVLERLTFFVLSDTASSLTSGSSVTCSALEDVVSVFASDKNAFNVATL